MSATASVRVPLLAALLAALWSTILAAPALAAVPTAAPLAEAGASAQSTPTGPPAETRPPAVSGDAAERLRARSRPPGTETRVWVEAEIAPRELYLGQQTTYTVWLYTRHRVSQVRPLAVPGFAGAWVREMPLPAGGATTTPVERDGQRIWRAPILRRALFPLKPGRLTIEATRLHLVVEVPERGPFDRVLERSRAIEADTAALTVEVNPLPPAPSGFAGAVGQVEIEATLDPPRVRPGEAAVLTVSARGTANFFTLPAPAIELPDGLDLLPPYGESSDQVEDGRLVSQRSWRFVVLPQEPGSWRIPPVELVYFDPATRRYRRAASEPLALEASTAREATSAEAPTGEPPAEATSSRAKGELRNRGWRIGLIAGAVTLVLASWVLLLRRRRRRTTDPQLAAALAEAAREEDPRRRAAALEAAWSSYLDHRWGLGSIPARDWQATLAGRGADPALPEALGRLADELAQLRSAPQLADLATLADAVTARSDRLARRIGA